MAKSTTSSRRRTASTSDKRPEVQALLGKLRASLPALEALLSECHDSQEDGVYRFYHQSFKVYRLQSQTTAIVKALQALAPERPLDERFTHIVREGTGKVFAPADNRRWPEVTRPIVEAFSHALYFLEMAVHYGRALEHAPNALPSGWAALLTLYGLR